MMPLICDECGKARETLSLYNGRLLCCLCGIYDKANAKKTRRLQKAKQKKGTLEAKEKMEKVREGKQITGIGSFVKELISSSETYSKDEILIKVRDKFPTARTSMSCINWYVRKMGKK